MKTNLLYLFFIIVIFQFVGCNKCVEHQEGAFTFSSQELLINPYVHQGTIILKNSDGDSLQFSIGKRTSTMIKRYWKYATYGNSTDCMGNYNLLEKNETSLTSINNLWNFSIILSYEYSASKKYDKTITLWANSFPNQSNQSTSAGKCNFEIDTLYNYFYNKSDTALIFHENLTLGLKAYQDVYEILLGGEIVKSEVWAIRLYYSIKQGIVGFKTRQNEIWFLI